MPVSRRVKCPLSSSLPVPASAVRAPMVTISDQESPYAAPDLSVTALEAVAGVVPTRNTMSLTVKVILPVTLL
jgi:hypothetical protein